MRFDTPVPCRSAARFVPAVLLGLTLLCLFGACGRRGPLRPYSETSPAAVTNLKAVRQTDGVLLSWSHARTYRDGASMTDLGGFEIQRRERDSDRPFETIATVAVTDRDRFRQAKRFQYLDRAIDGAPAHAYRVVSFTLDGYFSAPSNAATADSAATPGENNAPFPQSQR